MRLTLECLEPVRDVVKSDKFKYFGGLYAHMGFIIGFIAFNFGITMLGLALKLPPALAAVPGTTSIVSGLMYMALFQTGIIGLPGISGPPIPARVILTAVGLVLNINMFVTAADGTYKNDASDDLWTKLIIVYIIAVGIPHGIAAMHRNNGWEVPLMEGIGNSNVEPSLNPEKAAGVDMEASGAEEAGKA